MIEASFLNARMILLLERHRRIVDGGRNRSVVGYRRRRGLAWSVAGVCGGQHVTYPEFIKVSEFMKLMDKKHKLTNTVIWTLHEILTLLGPEHLRRLWQGEMIS